MCVPLRFALRVVCQADIDSAFRRVPVHPEHRQYGYIVFRHKGKAVVAKHLGLPFGAVASVHHWERTGELIKAIARRLLHLPVLRQVCAMRVCACLRSVVDCTCQVRGRLLHCRPQREHSAREANLREARLLAHVARCAFATFLCACRLTRCLLGETAIAKHKLQHANPLPVLGINVGIGRAGVIFQPEAEKTAKWMAQIKVTARKLANVCVCAHVCLRLDSQGSA